MSLWSGSPEGRKDFFVDDEKGAIDAIQFMLESFGYHEADSYT